MTDTKIANETVRQEFHRFYESAYRPKLNYLVKIIGVGYPDFVDWKNGKRDYGIRNLTKIRRFLSNCNQIVI